MIILPDSRLFSQFFSSDFRDESVLFPSEHRLISTSGPKRASHFSTGRYCAREALGQLGAPLTAVLSGEGREPLWPAGFTGSISHSDHLTGAVAARTEDLRAIGLDIETTGGVTTGMWDALFTPAEIAFLQSLDEAGSSLLPTILFSIKESFYKLQYPLTKLFLEFKDVEVVSRGEGFGIRIIHPDCKSLLRGEAIRVSWMVWGNEVVSWCYLA